MQPKDCSTKPVSITARPPRRGMLPALTLLTAAAVSAPVHSAEPQLTPGNYDCNFSSSMQSAAGTNPFSVAIGDLNNDGMPDIVAANEGSNDVSILLATGAGTFATATQVAVGNAPQSVLVDDISGDGRLDLVVANHGDDTLTIRLGTGTGTFGSPATLSVGNGPRAVAAADLNNDSRLDLVVANGAANSVSVLLGTGAGAFAADVAYAVDGNPSSVAIGDFNEDGKPDLAVASEGSATLSTLFGNGAGGFGTATPVPVGSQPRSVVSGDFDADGGLDLAVANWDSGTVSILLGSGGGGFAPAMNYPASALPTALAVADLDADGKADLLAANETSLPNIISVLRGLGNGSFAAATTVPLGGVRPRGLAAGDFNADGIPDLAVANYSSNDLSILLGDCAPIMNIAPNADVDRSSSYELRKSPVWFDRSRPDAYTHVVTHTDLNRDGRTDLVRASIRLGQTTPVEFLMQTAGGSFVDQTATVLSNGQPGMVYPRKGLNGDYNGDGWPDVLILGTGEDAPPFPGEFNQLFLSNGDGTLRYSAALEGMVGYHHGGASADIDGNGTIDVLTMNAGGPGDQSAFFLINDGQGNFTRNTNRLPSELLNLPALYTFELIDVDRDGYVDVISAGNEWTEGVAAATIYWGSNSGLYRATARTVLPKAPGNGGVLDFAAEDIDGDGDRDMIISRFPDFFATNGRYFQILRQVSPRQFVDETASRITMNTNVEAFDYFRVQDINGDGSLDIFIDDRHFASIGEYAWTNNGQGVFAPYSGAVNPVVAPPQPAFQINAGLNDAWYDPLTDGQGFFITVFPGSGIIFLSWFTYDTALPPDDATAALGDPGHRWLTAQGVYAGNQAVMDITITSGGIFDTMADVSRRDDGTIILTFNDCTSGTVEYDIPSIDRQGIVPIQRIVNDNVALCTELNGQGNVQSGGSLEDLAPLAVDPEMNAGLNDAWFNPATSGQGFFVTVFPDISTVFLAWFTFDTDPPPEMQPPTLATRVTGG